MGVRQKREYLVTIQKITGEVTTETIAIENEYLAGKLILKANPGSTLIQVMCVRVFQTVCPLSGALIFHGDETRVKNGKIVARNDI
ncbi:hypothetical protein Enr17x_15790 [Gimesia fumaroli]|uniref:Uncharacterized protein n=1 Tax=Gimesia fumaroli TaxID=2527976 RepID=A0A518I932_9PLAN|nr:hypothetical protein Enr17x_15790 [Gimesia fumaroli]